MPRILHRICSRAISLTLLAALAGSPLGCRARAGEPSLPPAGDLPELAVRVQVATATRGTLSSGRVHTGFLEPYAATRVAAEAAGTVSERGFADGQPVKAGALLFRLESGRQRITKDGADAAVDAAETELRFLRAERARAERLVERKAAPTRQLDAARINVDRAEAQLAQAKVGQRQAARALADTVLRAPHDGVVHGRQVDVGDQVAPGRPLLELIDLSRVRLKVGVAGHRVAQLKPGRQATLVVDDLGGAAIDAELIAIAPRSDPRTGLFEVLFEAIPPAELGVRAGMIARVQLDMQAADRLLIPRGALVQHDGHPALYVINGDRAERRRVLTGATSPTHLAITSGLQEGERVVVGGQHAIADGVKVIADEVATTPLGGSTSPGGTDAEGPAAEGPAAERPAAEGSAAEGSAAEGSAAEGSAAEGSAAEGSAAKATRSEVSR